MIIFRPFWTLFPFFCFGMSIVREWTYLSLTILSLRLLLTKSKLNRYPTNDPDDLPCFLSQQLTGSNQLRAETHRYNRQWTRWRLQLSRLSFYALVLFWPQINWFIAVIALFYVAAAGHSLDWEGPATRWCCWTLDRRPRDDDANE